MSKRQSLQRSSGQAVLLVLVVVAVALTFGLSTIARTTTETKISYQEQEATRAFNAAEAGIEEALRNVVSIAGSGLQTLAGFEDIDVSYQVEAVSSLESSYAENETAQVNLVGAGGGTITLEWVKQADENENPGCVGEAQTPASLLVTIVKGAGGGYAVRRQAFNACGALDNGMELAGDSGDASYLKKAEINLAADDELMRIRPIYNQTSIRVTKDDLPEQYYRIVSTAEVKLGESEETFASKAVQVTRTVPATPSVFDYVLFSGSSISK